MTTNTLKKKMSILRDIQTNKKPKLINPVTNPRYDETYTDGVAWLESLSDKLR